MATQTQTQRRASAKKAAATRKRNTSRSTASRTRSSARSTASGATSTATSRAKAEASGIQAFALQAERAVLIPVGAALTARDNVVENVKPFTSRPTADRATSNLQPRGATNLPNHPRRGTTARNKLPRELR